LIVAFYTVELRAVCESEAAAVIAFGPAVASQLRRRLADLKAASTVADLIAGDPRKSADGQTLEMSLGDGAALILRPNHTREPSNGIATIVWEEVRRLQLLQIRRDDAEVS
jgi:hypothetical protein